MTKITALHGGGDWADASAQYLVLPDGLDIEAEAAKRNTWYRNEYCPALRSGKSIEYLSLYDWLKRAGARDPLPEELTIYEE